MVANALQQSALSRLYSSAVIRELAKIGQSQLFSSLLGKIAPLVNLSETDTVGDAYEQAFSVLKCEGLRDEYIYRAALTNKILLGRHNLQTASMLSEFRAGVCKADVVILNGTATVYEIKSERDSLARLQKQIENYMQVFASVNVITCEKYITSVASLVSEDVGILCLSKRFQISEFRPAVVDPSRVIPDVIFDSLRSDEIRKILSDFGIGIASVPNTQLRRVMKADFINLPPSELHEKLVCTLKKTRTLSPLSEIVAKLPKSLHAGVLSVPLRRSDYSRLVKAVSEPLVNLESWGDKNVLPVFSR